jgi:hypothetical protein
LFISGWLEKSTSTRNKFAPKTNLAVSSAELTRCLVYECKIRILTFVELPFAKYWENTWAKSQSAMVFCPSIILAVSSIKLCQVIFDEGDIWIGEGSSGGYKTMIPPLLQSPQSNAETISWQDAKFSGIAL